MFKGCCSLPPFASSRTTWQLLFSPISSHSLMLIMSCLGTLHELTHHPSEFQTPSPALFAIACVGVATPLQPVTQQTVRLRSSEIKTTPIPSHFSPSSSGLIPSPSPTLQLL